MKPAISRARIGNNVQHNFRLTILLRLARVLVRAKPHPCFHHPCTFRDLHRESVCVNTYLQHCVGL